MRSWNINERERNWYSEGRMFFYVICWLRVWGGRIWEWDRVEGVFFEDKDDLIFCRLRKEEG